MKKSYKLENLDCANCAAKMENGIKKIDGVEDVKISFMTQRLTLVADEDKFPIILEEASKICRNVDSDCKIIIR